MAHDDASLVTSGTWTNVGGFKESTMSTATLALMFMGDEATLTMGTGPDHSIYDVYIGRTLWLSFDGYAATAGERQIGIQLNGEGPHVLEIRNRRDKNVQSSGYKVRFKQLVVPDQAYALHTIKYEYDALSRLQRADIYPGANVGAAAFRQYEYGYDLAGNRLMERVTVNGTPVTTNYAYNDANQLTSDGTNALTYDANGNLISDGVNSYTWDRANRLLSMGGASYAYDGAGNRIQQTVGTDITKYLLDVQPGLAVVLSATTGTDTTRYVHGARGIHAQQDNVGVWDWLVQDGLGSARAVVDGTLAVQEQRMYAPYGEPYDGVGTSQTVYGFTGEPTDANALVYLRARYLNPALGVFASLDPIYGVEDVPMSLNGYSYAEGNVPNWNDPNGTCPENPWWNDIPGQRCVWLANELHQKYGWPLDVLMQKDWQELETVYAWGNANSTFNESSWSQTLRDNPGAAAGVAGGAAIGVAAIVLTGGAATPAVLAIAGSALGGGVTGGVLGTGYGAAMYQIAVSGQCGCAAQQQALNIGQGEFISRAREQGALYGTVYAGLFASGPVGQVAAGAGGIAQGAEGLYSTGQDINANGINVCNTINGILSIAGIATGARVAVRGYNQLRTQNAPISSSQLLLSSGQVSNAPALPIPQSQGYVIYLPGPTASPYMLIGTPTGVVVPVPNGWIGRVANNARGIVFQRPGATGNADMIRIGDATPMYPNGYVRFYNSHGQPLDIMGRPGNQASTHIPLNYTGPIIGWPR